MKIKISLIILLFSFTCCQSQIPKDKDEWAKAYIKQIEKSNIETINKPFPSFSVLYNGNTIDNNSLKGKIVFINFWFEGCAPCIAEFEALNNMYSKLKDKKDFEYISFTFETAEKIKEIKEKYNIQYKIISIKREDCYKLNNKNGFPTSIIIDSHGLVKYIKSGGSTDKDKASEFVMKTFYPEILKSL